MREHLVHDIRSSPAISNNGGSREAVVAGFGAFRVVDDGSVRGDRNRNQKPRLLQLNTEIKLKACRGNSKCLSTIINKSYRQEPTSLTTSKRRATPFEPGRSPQSAVGSKPPRKHQPPVFLTHGQTLVFKKTSCAYDAPSGKVPHIHHICIPIDSKMGPTL